MRHMRRKWKTERWRGKMIWEWKKECKKDIWEENGKRECKGNETIRKLNTLKSNHS